MADFDWAGFAGDALPAMKNLIGELPGAIATDRLVKRNNIDNGEGYAKLQEMAERISTDPELSGKMGAKFQTGNDPKALYGKIMSYFRAPDKGEDNGKYINKMGEGFMSLVGEGFDNFRDADVLGTLLNYSPDEFEGKSLGQMHDSLINREKNDAYESRLLEKGEDGSFNVKTGEDRISLRNSMGINRDAKFDAEKVVDSQNSKDKLRDIILKVEEIKANKLQGVVDASEPTMEELKAELAALGTSVSDIKFWTTVQSGSDEQLAQLGIDKKTAEIANVEARTDLVNNTILKNKGKADEELFAKMNIPAKVFDMAAEKARAGVEKQQRLIISAKNAKDNASAKIAQQRLKDFENLVVVNTNLSDSANANNGFLPSEEVPERREGEELGIVGKNITDQFRTLKERSSSSFDELASNQGFKTVSFSPQEATLMKIDGSGEPFKLNLVTGDIISAEQVEAPTQIREKQTSSFDLSVEGDSQASADKIFSDLKASGEPVNQHTFGITASQNGFKVVNFNESAGVATVVDRDGIESIISLKDEGTIDYGSLLNQGL